MNAALDILTHPEKWTLGDGPWRASGQKVHISSLPHLIFPAEDVNQRGFDYWDGEMRHKIAHFSGFQRLSVTVSPNKVFWDCCIMAWLVKIKAFMAVSVRLLVEPRFALSWADMGVQDRLSTPKKSGTRVKYTCPGCKSNFVFCIHHTVLHREW